MTLILQTLFFFEVWIHGGGFTGGTASDPNYYGETLSSYGNVILVNINYRLGAFGFFYTGDERMPNGKYKQCSVSTNSPAHVEIHFKKDE